MGGYSKKQKCTPNGFQIDYELETKIKKSEKIKQKKIPIELTFTLVRG